MNIFSQRQIEIIFEFYNNQNQYIKLATLSDKFNLTTRTIQNDIKSLKQICFKNGLELISSSGKGCMMQVIDLDKSGPFIANITKNYYDSYQFSNQNSRINFLVGFLIKNNKYIKSQELADMIYVSHSRISSDLKILRKVLAGYQLTLVSKPSFGIKILGSEENIRYCLIKENILVNPLLGQLTVEKKDNQVTMLDSISNIVSSSFLDNQFRISDIVLQNLIIHIYAAVTRMTKGHYVRNRNTTIANFNEHSLKLAQKIMTRCCATFDLEYSETEMFYLAINISSKREFDDENFISTKTSTIVIDALNRIKQMYNIDLTNELDLRISLGLHITPLMIRVENDIQFSNMTLLNIQQSYPLAFNVASDFSKYIFSKNVTLTIDEISYIAVHFISILEKKISYTNTNRILIICPYRRSDTILMQQKIMRLIDNVSEIEISSLNSINPDEFRTFNAIITTEKEIAKKYPDIRLVNYFINDNDLKKIEAALKGLNNINDILKNFDQDVFFIGSAKSKKEIIKVLFDKAKKKYGLTNELYKSIILHEEHYTSSYFGNGIAIPHPEELITDISFVGVGILTDQITWGYDDKVSIVFLVSIEKNKPSAFQLWNHLSLLISNETFLSKIQNVTDFSDFMNLIKGVYIDLF